MNLKQLLNLLHVCLHFSPISSVVCSSVVGGMMGGYGDTAFFEDGGFLKICGDGNWQQVMLTSLFGLQFIVLG